MQHKNRTEQPDMCQNLTQQQGIGEKVRLVETHNPDLEHLVLSYTTNICFDLPILQHYNSSKDILSYGIEFEIKCDPSYSSAPRIRRNDAKSNDYMQYIEIESTHGCKLGDLNGIWRFVDQNPWIFFIVFVIVGAFYTFFGRIYLKVNLFIIGTMTTIAVFLFMFYVIFLPNNVEQWVGWVILLCATFIGLIAGFFVAQLAKIGVSLIAAWAGASIALLLSNMAFYKIESVAVLWIMILAFAIILALLSFIFFDLIIIFSTSLLGSYLVMRGISFVVGGYINEFELYERIKTHELDKVPATFYFYMNGVCILAVIGFFIQIYKLGGFSRNNDKKDEYLSIQNSQILI